MTKEKQIKKTFVYHLVGTNESSGGGKRIRTIR